MGLSEPPDQERCNPEPMYDERSRRKPLRGRDEVRYWWCLDIFHIQIPCMPPINLDTTCID